MSDNDQMTDTAELRDRVAGLAGSVPPPLEAITARGRARRRHRRFALAGLCVAGATAATALAFDLTGVAGPAGPTAAPATIRAAAPAMIRTVAFTIVGNHDGTVTLTINPLELFDPTALEDDLAQYDIPALVTIDKMCTSDPAPADISEVDRTTPVRPVRMPRSRSTRRPCQPEASSASARSDSTAGCRPRTRR